MAITYIQKKIKKLMTTSTGSHFLDSGGAYGRHWERNQKRKLDFNEGLKLDDYGVSIPIHVYMDTMFETNNITAMFNKLLAKDYYWTQEALEVLLDAGFELDLESYGSDSNNTYNFENDLSQDFQYQVFEYDGDHYCIFQLHQGCDIRGGYTSATVFKISDIDYFYIGMRADFYDNSTQEEFESYYSISEDERYKLDESKGCFINIETNEEVYPYSSALGF